MDYAFFMQKALVEAEHALAQGEFPVGCILVYRNRVLVTGARSGTAGPAPNETDHAEMTALRKLAGLDRIVEPGRITLFCTLEPCLMCYAATLLSGIGKIVYAYEDRMGGGTACDLETLAPLYGQRRIPVVANVLRSQSLDLFKQYFSNPENPYWRDSLLARYTLAQ